MQKKSLFLIFPVQKNRIVLPGLRESFSQNPKVYGPDQKRYANFGCSCLQSTIYSGVSGQFFDPLYNNRSESRKNQRPEQNTQRHYQHNTSAGMIISYGQKAAKRK